MTQDEWDGKERRQEDPWRVRIEEDIKEIKAAQRCMSREWGKFMTSYEDTLKETVESKARREKLWAAATEKLVTAGVWAAVVFLAGVVITGLKINLRTFLS